MIAVGEIEGASKSAVADTANLEPEVQVGIAFALQASRSRAGLLNISEKFGSWFKVIDSRDYDAPRNRSRCIYLIGGLTDSFRPGTQFRGTPLPK